MGLMADSFSKYATADINKRWTNYTGFPALGAGYGRSGRYGADLSNGTLRKTMTASNTWCLGFGIKFGSIPTGETTIAGLDDAGTRQVTLSLLPDGTFRVYRGTSTNVLGTSTYAINAGTEYHLEWKTVIGDAAGTSELRVNGTARLSITGADTQSTANATANQYWIGGSVGGISQRYSDLVARNAADAASFLGDRMVEARSPNADGAHAQWTPSTGATQYGVLDEAPPSAADYLSEATAGEKTSVLFPALALVGSGSVDFMELVALLEKDDGAARQARLATRVGGADYNSGVTEAIAGIVYYSHVWSQNPATAAPWTLSEANAFEAVVELMA